MIENNRLRDKNGQFAKKNLYLIETCRKCPVKNCEGIFAIKHSKVVFCPKRNKYKKGEKQ